MLLEEGVCVVGRGCLCCWKRVFVLLEEGVCSWQISGSLCPASFCTLKPNLPEEPEIKLPTFLDH